MSPDEFIAWRIYHELYPFDDHHRIQRPAILLAGLLGGDVSKLKDWFDRVPDPTAHLSDADRATLSALGGKPPRKT